MRDTRLWIVAVALLLGVACLGRAPMLGADEVEVDQERAQELEEQRERFTRTRIRGSKARRVLQREVAAELFRLEQVARPACTPTLLNAKTKTPSLRGPWTERWFVRGCQQIVPYQVVFTPDPDAETGVTFAVSQEATDYGSPTR